MKTSFSNQVLYLAWKLGISLVERLYVRPSRWVVGVSSALVTLWPVGCALVVAFMVFPLALKGIQWAYGVSSAAYSGDGWLWGVCLSVVSLALIILALRAGVNFFVYLCRPFGRFRDASERLRLEGLLEGAYPDTVLPICCSTRWEAWLVAYLFDDARQAPHRQRALSVRLPAATSSPSSKTRF